MEQFLNNPILLLIIIVWSMFWKGWALWRAARNEQKYWFIALLLVNSLGILEIAYLFWFSKKKNLLERIKTLLPWKKD
ncbi:MAG: DUF5652 family protein [Candidatus Marinimicrobia bacterium]|nr:DUF5652 family protein [Candidatus Neomarinimicrobiota bacterium]